MIIIRYLCCLEICGYQGYIHHYLYDWIDCCWISGNHWLLVCVLVEFMSDLWCLICGAPHKGPDPPVSIQSAVGHWFTSITEGWWFEACDGLTVTGSVTRFVGLMHSMILARRHWRYGNVSIKVHILVLRINLALVAPGRQACAENVVFKITMQKFQNASDLRPWP